MAEKVSSVEVKIVEAQEAEIKRLQALIEEMKAATEAARVDENSATMSRASTKERWAIIIDEGDNQEMSSAPIGINGRVYLIMRGRVAEVPPEVLDVLDHAILDKSSTIFDETTGMAAGNRIKKVRRFPYQKLGMAVNAAGERLQKFDDLNDPDRME